MNLAITHAPKTWSEFKYHPKQVKQLQDCLRTNNHPLSIFVSGHTGTGKTNLISLYLRALHCQNRKPGEIDPCNNCPPCLVDPRTTGVANNVLWVQRGQEDSVSEQFKTALEEAFQPPYGFDEEHRWYKAIVFDELQSIPRDKQQDLLFYPELPQLRALNKVIFIFITMNEGRIDPEIRSALQDRSLYLMLKKIPASVIKEQLISLYPEAPLEAIKMIAKVSDGSFRRAYSQLSNCLAADPSLSVISVADTLNFATAEVRQHFWHLLEHCTPQTPSYYSQLWAWWQEMQPLLDIDRFFDQLDEDIDVSLLVAPSADQLTARKILMLHRIASASCSPWTIIKSLQGLKIVSPATFADTTQSGFEILTRQLDV